ncbi:M20/M25/M40 family metallo-hydrolase [Brevibacillus centrosporus]|uniref:M20/M25/M40 family metallo-hydrolase n=1 Tax=Brevibacillus centrosporus TaxID=54910 RepID=UPI002E1D597E|nr:M20/M25/M40 family metallo-hydrolase [Brevibacillus centrosporus]MED4909405.1 M20/M25/M40 family metallo-hydrolase [Brevibacillus centrosporus]
MKKIETELYELLQIIGPSGQEEEVIRYIRPRMEKVLEHVHLDDYGNLLGESVCGSGAGPTVLLCAHMDTVDWIVPGREVKRDGDVLTSSEGVLGADDRAGMAIVMAAVRNVRATDFSGRLKIAFTREEEVGRCGSKAMDRDWLSDVDLAIVVDRRGNRDIVTSRGQVQPFCDPAVGVFFEQAGAAAGMPDWRAVQGGISDACTFACYGINSVNLSAGYLYEHTEQERVDLRWVKETTKLILTALDLMMAGRQEERLFPDRLCQIGR